MENFVIEAQILYKFECIPNIALSIKVLNTFHFEFHKNTNFLSNMKTFDVQNENMEF